jgi:hypothetical protein
MKILALSLCLSCLISPAFAQENAAAPSTFDREKYCKVVAEEIIPLRLPNFDGAVEWKRTTGIQGMDRPKDMVLLADNGVVVLGESALFFRKSEAVAAGKPEGAQATQMAFLRVDRGGRIVTEKRIDVPGLKSVVAGAVLKDRIVALSQVASPKGGDVVRIDFLDGGGEGKASRILSDKKYRLIPVDVAADSVNGQLVLAVQAVSRTNADDRFTMVIRVDASGKEISRREYLPGIPTRLESLDLLAGGWLIGAGRIEMSGDSGADRSGGWILKLTRQGDIVQQRPYPRGAQALIRRVVSTGDGDLIAVGDAIPAAGGGARAAWIMRLAPSGEPIWQKYITGHYSYSGIDVAVLPDGRVNVLMAGRPAGEGGREHARLVTLTRTGQMTGEEAYIEAANALPAKLLLRDGRRIVAGMAQTGFSNEGVSDAEHLATYDFWIVGLTSLADYADPCGAIAAEKLEEPL